GGCPRADSERANDDQRLCGFDHGPFSSVMAEVRLKRETYRRSAGLRPAQVAVRVLEVAAQLLALLGRHLALLPGGPAAAITVDVAHVFAHALALLAAHVLRLELAFVPLSGLRGRHSRGERKHQRKEQAFHGCGNVTRVRFRRRVAIAEICNNVLPDARAQDPDPRRRRRPAPARPAGAL